MSALKWIEEWYLKQCNGDWEHGSGISIETLDNPGWSVDVNLNETALEGRKFDRIEVGNSKIDWWHCWIEKNTFHGRGGPRNLETIPTIFKDWAEKES